jgi:hypothetical protein
VVGKFYNEHGEPLPFLIESEKLAREFTAQEAAKEAKEAVIETLCNVSWKKSEGGWVYCKEGLVPRKIEIPSSLENSGSGGGGVDGGGGNVSHQQVQERCMCVVYSSDIVIEGKQVYEGCSAESSRCQTSKPDQE